MHGRDYYYSYRADKETEPQRSDLPKVTQLLSIGIRAWARNCYALLSPLHLRKESVLVVPTISKTLKQVFGLLWVCPFPLFLENFEKFLSRQDQLDLFMFMIKRHQHVLHLLKRSREKWTRSQTGDLRVTFRRRRQENVKFRKDWQ